MKKTLLILYIILFTASTQLAAAQEADNTIEMVENAVKLALNEEGIDGKLDVNINGYRGGFNLAGDQDLYQVYVNAININERNERFKADIAFINQSNKTTAFQVNGGYSKLVSIPVLSNKMPRNSVIEEGDIFWLEMASSQISFDTVMEADKLIGQALKRSMSNATPLKERDLQKVQILSRNTTVDIIYNTPTISLRTTGIALDSGGEGDIVRVRNTSSNKIIQATVQNENTVAALHTNNNLTNQTASIEDNTYVR